MKKSIFGLLIVFVMLFGLSSAASAADTAYLMYADANWTYQYMGGDAENGIVATNAEVTGAGAYTVGLDFTGTEAGSATGMAFSAVGIATGEQTFTGFTIEITSITVNGEPIAFEKGYTSSDDGIVTRMNLFNEWVSALPSDARSYDGDITDAAAAIVDKTLFATVRTVDVAFTLHPGASDRAFLMYADASWTYQYWGGAPENGVVATNATVTGSGPYTVGLDFTGTTAGFATNMAFAGVGIATGEQTFPGSFIEITAIRVNGTAVPFEKGYTSSDDGVTTRMNIFNEWVSALPDDARSFDGNTSDSNWIIVDRAAFAEVRTAEVDFNFTVGGGAAGTAGAEIDVEAALAANYNAYFGVQTETFIFRNTWDEASYGMATANWTHLTGWDADGNQVDYGGSFTDTAITGNGDYTVSVRLGDMGFGEDQLFNLLFVSTDIPSALITDGLVTISNVRTSMDGGEGREFTYVNTDGDYAVISVMNKWDAAVGTETIPYNMPSQSIAISFTIDGLTSRGLPVWALILIIVGGVLVVAGVVILILKKKKPAQKSA